MLASREAPRAIGALDPRTLAVATFTLLLGVFAVGSEALVISPLLDDIAVDLGTSVERAGLSVSVYGIAVALTAPAAGAVANRLSRRGTILLGLGIFAGAGALCAAAPDLRVLVAGRALCGLGAGLFLPAAYAWVGDEVPYLDRSRVMGRVVAGWALALVVGVPAGGLVGQAAGWREALALMAVLAFAAAAAAARALPARSGAARRAPGAPAGGLLAAVRTPGVPLLLTVNLLDMLAFYGVYTYLGTFLRDELDTGSAGAAGLILLYGVGVAVTSLRARLLDRLGNARAITWALVALAGVFAALPWLGAAVPALAGLLVAMGIAQAAVLVSVTTLMTATPAPVRGSAVALMSCTSYLGVTVGAAVGGLVLAGPGYWLVGVGAAVCVGVAALLFATAAVPVDEVGTRGRPER